MSQVGIFVLFAAGPIAGVSVLKGNLSSALLFETVPLMDPLPFLQVLAAGYLMPVSTGIIGAVLVLGFYWLVGGRALH